jgi:hypothetical protein
MIKPKKQNKSTNLKRLKVVAKPNLLCRHAMSIKKRMLKVTKLPTKSQAVSRQTSQSGGTPYKRKIGKKFSLDVGDDVVIAKDHSVAARSPF